MKELLKVGDLTTFKDYENKDVKIGDIVYHYGLKKLFVVAFGWYEVTHKERKKVTTKYHYGLHLAEWLDRDKRHSFDLAYYCDESMINTICRHDYSIAATLYNILSIMQ